MKKKSAIEMIQHSYFENTDDGLRVGKSASVAMTSAIRTSAVPAITRSV